MARLAAADRARLPDSAFAYIDRQGRRRLPIHDEAHVRNALARFNQVAFENDQARERALTRLLKAAKRYRIVPVGFIATQLQTERSRSGDVPLLPSGFVTMLFTDIEGSTELVARLGDGYGGVLDGVQTVLRGGALDAGGHLVEVRADELFAVFERPDDAVRMAVAAQRALHERRFGDGEQVRVRIGIHSGYPTCVPGNYIGMAVHIAARVSACGHGGQIVVSGDTREALTGRMPEGVRLRSLGWHRLRGIPQEVALYQVAAKGLPVAFPPLRAVRGAS